MIVCGLRETNQKHRRRLFPEESRSIKPSNVGSRCICFQCVRQFQEECNNYGVTGRCCNSPSGHTAGNRSSGASRSVAGVTVKQGDAGEQERRLSSFPRIQMDHRGGSSVSGCLPLEATSPPPESRRSLNRWPGENVASVSLLQQIKATQGRLNESVQGLVSLAFPELLLLLAWKNVGKPGIPV